MQAVDDSIASDDRDVINSVAFEKLCRRAYGLERAHEDVWKEEDWRRPEGGGAAKGKWRSKVKWDLCEQYDLRGLATKATRIALADAEAQESMQRETAFHKYYTKMSDARGPGDGPAP